MFRPKPARSDARRVFASTPRHAGPFLNEDDCHATDDRQVCDLQAFAGDFVMSGGRPRVYTAEIAERILGELMDGRPLTEICRDPGLPAERTVRNWVLDDYEGFAPRYSRAREVGYHAMADQLVVIADDGSGDHIERRKENGDVEIVPNPVNI